MSDDAPLPPIGPDAVHLCVDMQRMFAEHTDTRLQHRGIDTVVVSGGETEVCVLATVLGAVDLGYRVVIATDALCSSSDETHDAALDLFHRRYAAQVETATTEAILAAWPAGP